MSHLPEIHADGPGEFALCGLAFDAFDSGDVDEPRVCATTGQRVTCAICLQMIDHVYVNFTRTGMTRAIDGAVNKVHSTHIATPHERNAP